MGVCVRVMFNQIENYMTNVDEVMLLIETYDHLFKAREGSKTDGKICRLHEVTRKT